MDITQTLKKWGNGQGVRLPKKVMRAAKIELDAELKVSLKGRSIVLTPVGESNNLTAMLSGVTPRDIGGEQNWGVDVGAEAHH
jgi:antitoxin MazE